MNIQGWFPLGLTGLISVLSKGLSRVFFSTTIWKHQFFSAQPSWWSNTHICTWLLKIIIALTIWAFVSRVMGLDAMILAFRIWISSIQSLSCVQLFATQWTSACQASLSITNSCSPPKLMSIESVNTSNHLILCHPLLLLPSIFDLDRQKQLILVY